MAILGPSLDAAEFIIKNTFCDIVKPRIGSILKVDLILSSIGPEDFCHTGIYIGNDEIVELTENGHKKAEIRIVSSEKFIEGDAPLPRTGLCIYVACGKDENGDCYALCSRQIADRAKAAVGEIWNGDYSLRNNNCHIFCQYCITGKKKGHSCLLSGIEDALKKTCGTDEVYWRSTGESRGDNPCFVDDDETESDNDPEADEDFEDEENSEFEELLEKAESGDAESQYQVGQMYFTGDGIELDEGEAMDWFERAAQNGHAEAMYELGECYYLGMGVEEDEEEAVKWYRKAARKGHVEAMYKMAGCYYSGDGVAESDARAKHWYQKAAEAGHKEAKKALKKYF